jgi:hypothetical protein
MSKIVTIHQPEAFPWLGFFNKMMLADEYVILDNVKFRKNYFQNRNRFVMNGQSIFLTIPVEKEANSKIIKDVKISYTTKWQKKHLNTIKQSYKKAPFFKHYKDFFEDLYAQKFMYLIDFNMYVINFLRDILKIDTPIFFASKLNVSGNSSKLLLNICKKREADIYLSGRDGRNYLDVELFEKENIKVVYHNFIHPEYKQFNTSEFLPYMSTFDLLFNYPVEEAKEIIRRGGNILCEE